MIRGDTVEGERGQQRIEEIKIGERIWTRAGLRRVVQVVEKFANIYTVKFVSGRSLTGQFLAVATGDDDWRMLTLLQPGDKVLTAQISKKSIKTSTDIVASTSVPPSQIRACELGHYLQLAVEEPHEYIVNGLIVRD